MREIVYEIRVWGSCRSCVDFDRAYLGLVHDAQVAAAVENLRRVLERRALEHGASIRVTVRTPSGELV